ncbi:MAG: hypothetical protein K8J08_02840 [Thermoanaerobaculia bacterium]|nr:hypothetical protein [Thermoanaerobaculia bacterium]
MKTTAELAGFFAAHAVWCLSDGSTLVPMLASEGASGERQMKRLAHELLEDAVAAGKRELVLNPDSHERQVLLYDGYLTLEAGRTDALYVEARLYGSKPMELLVAVPYRHADSKQGFAVHRPKFLEATADQSDLELIGQGFFEGVGQHEQGGACWNEHFDESI